MKRIRFALLPAFMVAIVGAFAAQGSSKPNLAQYYKRVNATGNCIETTCVLNGTGTQCSSSDTYFSTKALNGQCQNQVPSSSMFLP